MFEFPKWRTVEQFDPYGYFKNGTNDFGREYLLSKSKVFCENQGSLLNVFDPVSTDILKLVHFIQRKKEEERFNFNLSTRGRHARYPGTHEYWSTGRYPSKFQNFGYR